MWTAILGAAKFLVKPVTTIIGNWQQNRREKAAAKHQAQLARIAAMASSWTDEFVIIIWAWPFVVGAVPMWRPYAMEYVTFLGTLPPWFVWGWISLSLAVFGVNKLQKIKLPK